MPTKERGRFFAKGVMRPRGRFDVAAKTADYTITDADDGKLFTNRGAAGAVIFTLPAVTAARKGMTVYFFVVADQNVTINATANEMVTFNDLDADGIAFSTATELIGAAVMAVCDGTSWLMFLMTQETQTVTVTT